MKPEATFQFAREYDARATTRREFAVALAIVLALHAALAAWMLSMHERPAEPVEMPRTIVAQLLSVAPAPPAPATKRAPAATQHPAPAVEPAPPRSHAKAAPPIHRVRPSPPASSSPPATATREAVPEAPMPAPAAPPAPAAAARAAPSPANAAPAAAPAPAQPAASTAAPKAVSHVDCSIAQPDYPEAAQRRGESGTAIVRFVVGVDGHVETARIQQSSGYPRLDSAALDALRGSACRPYRENGVAVRVVYAQPFVFGLGH